MKLLDTSIVIHAIGGPHIYREPCRRLLRDAAAGARQYMIDAELLQEVLLIYAPRAGSKAAFEVFDRLLVAFPDPLPVGREELLTARHLLERHPSLSTRDAIHAAVVMTHSLEGIVTTDKSLAGVGEAPSFDPLDLYLGQAAI